MWALKFYNISLPVFPPLRYPYPAATPGEGYWEPVTSTVNWCEEDCYATRYSAEIVNSLTNLAFKALGVKGIRNCLKNEHDFISL